MLLYITDTKLANVEFMSCCKHKKSTNGSFDDQTSIELAKLVAVFYLLHLDLSVKSVFFIWLSLELGPGKTKRNLRGLSKFNHNTVRWFQAGFRRVLGVFVTWWCFMIFMVVLRVWSSKFRSSDHFLMVIFELSAVDYPRKHVISINFATFEKSKKYYVCVLKFCQKWFL